MEFISSFISQYGYLAIFLLLSLGIIGLPIPDEILMTFVGFMCHEGHLNYLLSIFLSFLGSSTGMIISYAIGNKLGKPLILKYGKWIGLNNKRFTKVERWFHRFGPWTIIIGYYVPGIRHVTSYMSGITQMKLRTYLAFACFGALTWVIIFISIGYFVGVTI
ncbi:DedA family protein [Lysinibacillus sp. NPDC094403]|uniref:DedA family protein n=1 Tax=unclassified Lysinibacillus TaxID=2636778 RepID=UPI003CFEA7B6